MFRFDFENGVNDDGRSDGQAVHSIDEPHMPGLMTKNLHKEIRSSVRDSRMFGKLLSGRHQYRELDEFFQAVDIAQMFLCDCERVE